MSQTAVDTAAQVRQPEETSPEREQRRQMALRHVRQYPDPALRRKAAEVTEFDEELRALVERMWNIMDEAFGVGLAAPQLGLLQRVFTYRLEEGDDPGALVNPVIESTSDETDVDTEGCLSLGELRVEVRRPVAVKVRGFDVTGEEVTFDFEGFRARVFQHEIDHLDGVLMFERAADDDARKLALNYLRPKP